MDAIQPPLLSYLESQEAQRPADFIPVYTPQLGVLEEEYVLDAVRSGWISSLGAYVARFEAEFAAFCGTAHAVSASNGTTALHLALHALGLGPGDEAIVPVLTFIATANAVHYTGAQPVFADVDAGTWCMDPADVAQRITPRTKAIVAVHLYGHPAPMRELRALAAAHGLHLVEDAAEAHGAELGGQRAGALGDIAAFSFYANKIITTGEGGMLTTDDSALAARCRTLRDHAMRPENRYYHDEVGFNYRMTNLQAAVGAAQMQRIDRFIARKREIAARYAAGLAGVPGLRLAAERPGCKNVYWMVSLLVEDTYPLDRDALMAALRGRGVDSRPFFHSLDTLPPYYSDDPRPVALELSRRGLNLPSSPSLADAQIERICAILREVGGA